MFVFHHRKGTKNSVVDELERKSTAEYAESVCGALRDGSNKVHTFVAGRNGTRGAFVCRFGSLAPVPVSILRIPLGEGTLLVKLGENFQGPLKSDSTDWGWLNSTSEGLDVSSPNTAFFLAPDSIQRKTINEAASKLRAWAYIGDPVETAGRIQGEGEKCHINILADKNGDAWLSVFTRENRFRELCAEHAERFYKNGGISPDESVYEKFMTLVNAVQCVANITRGRIVTAIIERLVNDCNIDPKDVHGNLNDVTEGYSCVSCCFDEETRTLRRNCVPTVVSNIDDYKPVIHYHGGIIIAASAERPLYFNSAPYSIEMTDGAYDALYEDMFREEQRLSLIQNIFTTDRNE